MRQDWDTGVSMTGEFSGTMLRWLEVTSTTRFAVQRVQPAGAVAVVRALVGAPSIWAEPKKTAAARAAQSIDLPTLVASDTLTCSRLWCGLWICL